MKMKSIIRQTTEAGGTDTPTLKSTEYAHAPRTLGAEWSQYAMSAHTVQQQEGGLRGLTDPTQFPSIKTQ